MTYTINDFFDDLHAEIKKESKHTRPLDPDLANLYGEICNRYCGYIRGESLREGIIDLVLNLIQGKNEAKKLDEPVSKSRYLCCCGLFAKQPESEPLLPKRELSANRKVLEKCFLALQWGDFNQVEREFAKIKTVPNSSAAELSTKRRKQQPSVFPAPEPSMGGDLKPPQRPAPKPSYNSLQMPTRPAPLPPVGMSSSQ